MMDAILAAARKGRQGLISAASWGACVAFSIIFAINILQILSRPITGGFIWVHDLSALLFAWTVMLGAAAAYGKFDHVVASFLVERFSPTLQRLVAYFGRVVELLVGFLLVGAGLQVASTRMNIDYIQLGVPTGWAYLAVVALGLFILIFGLTATPRTPTTEDQIEAEVAALSESEPLLTQKRKST